MMAGICSNDCWLFHSSFSKFCCLHLDKTSLKVACSGSKESSVFAGPCQLNPDEVTCSSWFSGRKPCKSLRRAKEWGKKSRVGRFSCILNHGGAVGQKCSLAPQPPALAVMEKVLLGSLADEVSWLWKSESGAGGEKQGKKKSHPVLDSPDSRMETFSLVLYFRYSKHLKQVVVLEALQRPPQNNIRQF